MKSTNTTIVLTTLLAITACAAGAEVVTEATLGSRYQGNIFSDSTMTDDVQTTVGAGLRYYPASFAELTSSIEYSTFGSHRDLSNLTGGFSVTVIPSSGASRFTPALSASATTRRYGPTYEPYDQRGASTQIGFTYRLAPWIHLGSQASYSLTDYYNSESGSNRGVGLSGDLHLSIAGSNALSIGYDYSRRAYDQAFVSSGAGVSSHDESEANTETLGVSGVHLRYSRPLGMRTGVNLSVGRRFMHLDGQYVAPGYTVDFLSPWADLWSGRSFSCGLKHFFPGQLTAEVSAVYLDKAFIDAYELASSDDGAYERYSRDDQMTTVSLSLSRVVSLGPGTRLIPSLKAGYRDNRSSLALFDYHDYWASLSLSAGL